MTISASVRRFDARLRLYVALTRTLRGFDLGDTVLLVSLAFIFVGLAAPSAAFGVVGALLLPMTPIWTMVRLLITREPVQGRGR